MLYAVVIGMEVLILFLLSRKLHTGFGRLLYKITHSEKLTFYGLAILFLPGTFVHELAHFFVALVLLVPVGQIELMPEISEDGVKLGSVPVAKSDFVRRSLIGFAPTLVGFGLITAILSVVIARDISSSPFLYLAAAYAVFEIGNTMFLSKRDLEGSWKIVVLLVFVAVVGYFLGLRIDPSALAGIFTGHIVEVLKNLAILLAIPVVLDFSFVVLFRFAKLV